MLSLREHLTRVVSDGTLATAKMLSENPEQYPDAAVAGIRKLLGLQPGEAIPAQQIEAVKMGTTVATNTVLTGSGAKVGLVTTKGYRQVLQDILPGLLGRSGNFEMIVFGVLLVVLLVPLLIYEKLQRRHLEQH